MSEIQNMTRVEAEALLRYLGDVPAAGWEVATTCPGWTVRHVVAHLTALLDQTVPNLARRMIAGGFDFDKVIDGDLRRYLAGPDEMLALFEKSVREPRTPKMFATIALGEFVIHGEDIRRALGDRGVHPAEHVTVVANSSVTSGRPLHGKRRAKGLSFLATDGDFRWGDGPEVAGPGVDLVLAISGRTGALDTCSGPGVDVLRERTGETPAGAAR